MFEGFEKSRITTSGAEIVTVKGGSGPPLLLMHGNPFTHATWHKIAPRLAQDFTVVCTDLRGYADSSKPEDGENHADYSFRAMAGDQVEVMQALGFPRFHAAGHDRGARVLHRMCLDHPGAVQSAAFLDMLPQHHLLNNVTRQWGTFSWHWFFMIQPAPTPETDDRRRPRVLHPAQAVQDRSGHQLLRARGARRIHTLHQEPRGGARDVRGLSRDLRHRPGHGHGRRRGRAPGGLPGADPVGKKGGVGRNHDARAVWSRYATNIVRAAHVPSGHYLQEECPDETYAELAAFFRGQAGMAAAAAE